MNREQSAFLLGGVVLGLVAGLLLGLVFLQKPIGEPAARGTAEGAAEAPAGGAPPPSTGGMDPGAGGAAVMGEVMETLQRLKSDLEKNPEDVRALSQLGDMYFDAGKYEESRAFYERAVAVEPGNPRFMTALGLAELNLGQPKIALERYRTALDLSPDYWQAAAYAVIAAIELQDRNTADASLARLRALHPDFEHMKELEARVAQMGG